jgi:hypothetical protein
MMKKIKIGFVALLISTVANAIIITSSGYGINETESSKEALNELSHQISVNVKSNFTSYSSVLGKNHNKNIEKLISLSSNLPIKGVEYKFFEEIKLTKTIATLSSKNSLKSYILELKRLKRNIKDNRRKFENIKDDDIKYEILNNTLKHIQSFNKHKIVAVMLGSRDIPTINITESSIKVLLLKFENSVNSIKLASKILTKNINQKNVYLGAIKPSGSSEVTQFAKILKNNMMEYIKNEKFPNNAKYFLSGNYEILKNSIFITTNLTNKNGDIVNTSTITLNKNGYKNIKYKPYTKTFDESLNSGFIKSGKLSVNIGFKGYSRANGIDLNDTDKIDIVVKTNKDICYFLVGHTLKDDNNKFSYLIENIKNITGEDVNKVISIYEDVVVEAPFGSENLQIFVSSLSKDGKCPLVLPKCKKNDNEYCVINGKPSKIIIKTRALNFNKIKNKIEKAEDNISFTSFPKM